MASKKKPKAVMAWAIFADGKIKEWTIGTSAHEVWDCSAADWTDSQVIRVRIVPVTKKKRTKR